MSIRLKQKYETYLTETDPAAYEEMFGWPASAAPRFEPAIGDLFAFEWADGTGSVGPGGGEGDEEGRALLEGAREPIGKAFGEQATWVLGMIDRVLAS